MSNMVGTGPFITVPAILATLGGPQSLIAWGVGAHWPLPMVWCSQNWCRDSGLRRILHLSARMPGPRPLGPHDGLDLCLAISLQRHTGNCHQQHRHGGVHRISLAKTARLSMGNQTAGGQHHGPRRAGALSKDPGHCALDAGALGWHVADGGMGHLHGNDAHEHQAPVRFPAGSVEHRFALHAGSGQWNHAGDVQLPRLLPDLLSGRRGESSRNESCREA